jgi:hypothetical protein
VHYNCTASSLLCSWTHNFWGGNFNIKTVKHSKMANTNKLHQG